MRIKLTDTGIRAYRPRAKQYAIGDAACPGLCLRITTKGIKTFAFAYRNKGTHKVMWLTLGRYPDMARTRERRPQDRRSRRHAADAKGRARRSEKKLRPTARRSTSTSTPS
jgi:hypothetical protein